MKRQWNIVRILLVIMLAVAMAAQISAAQITVSNALVGETYNVYKILDAAVSGEHAAYTIPVNDTVWLPALEDAQYNGTAAFTFTLSAEGSVYQVAAKNEAFWTSGEAAAYFADCTANGAIPADATVTADQTTVSFQDLEPGYYYVSTSLGSACILDTVASEVTLTEKNTLPALKTELTAAGGLGDEATFRSVITDGEGTVTEIVFAGQLTGMDLDETSIRVTQNAQDVSDDAVSIQTSGDGSIQVALTADFVSDLGAGDTVEIVWSAVVNAEAIGDDGASAATDLTYGTQSIPAETVSIALFGFDLLDLDDGGELLEGGQFLLTNDSLEEIPLTLDNGVYRPALDGEETVQIGAGFATVKGLPEGYYYLTQTKAPDGYTLLTDYVDVTLDQDLFAQQTDSGYDGGVQVVNTAGVLLPSTGSGGTAVFYCIGILCAAAGMMLRKRPKC